MWTHENRAKYNRDHLRYPSDLTDYEWAHVEPFIPPAERGSGKRRTDMRAVMNGVMYVLEHGLPVALSFRRIFHHAVRSTTTSFGGSATACWIWFPSSAVPSNVARRRHEKPAHRLHHR